MVLLRTSDACTVHSRDQAALERSQAGCGQNDPEALAATQPVIHTVLPVRRHAASAVAENCPQLAETFQQVRVMGDWVHRLGKTAGPEDVAA